jgi:hypothetical protein
MGNEAYKPYDVGRMRQRLMWQVWDGSVDDMNEPLDSGFVTQGCYWAEVLPISGFERPIGKQDNAVSSGKIKMRNVGPIKPSDRFLFQSTGRIFDITSVLREGERNAYLLIEYTELKVPQ